MKWNTVFQEIIDIISTSTDPEVLLTAYNKLGFIYEDFVRICTLYGKLIITERWLEDSRKTLAPLNVGTFILPWVMFCAQRVSPLEFLLWPEPSRVGFVTLWLCVLMGFVSGGVAGGDKFIREGVFFKFNLDHHNLYGGTHNATKVKPSLSVIYLFTVLGCLSWTQKFLWDRWSLWSFPPLSNVFDDWLPRYPKTDFFG